MTGIRSPADDGLKEKVKREYEKGAKPKELSDKYGISINTLKSWIKRGSWGKTNEPQSAPPKDKGAPSNNKKGAPAGNKNAEGHGAPKKNRNAEKHGAYSKLYWDTLDECERELLESIPDNEEFQLQQQINMYTIRERRLMNRIRELQENATKTKGLYIKAVKSKKQARFDEGKKVNAFEDTTTETESMLKGLMALESELTKVQRAKTKSIDSLVRLKAEREKYDDLLNGWSPNMSSTSEAQEDDDEDDKGVVIYLPDNGRG